MQSLPQKLDQINLFLPFHQFRINLKFLTLAILCMAIKVGQLNAQSKTDWDSLYLLSNPVQLKSVKPVFETSAFECTPLVDRYLDSLAVRNLKANRIPGFRILLYSGNEREGAVRAKEQAYRIFQKADLYTTYQAPTFKVRLGDYYQRLDAFLDVKKLEAAFPQAVIIQEIVQLKP